MLLQFFSSDPNSSRPSIEFWVAFKCIAHMSVIISPVLPFCSRWEARWVNSELFVCCCHRHKSPGRRNWRKSSNLAKSIMQLANQKSPCLPKSALKPIRTRYLVISLCFLVLYHPQNWGSGTVDADIISRHQCLTCSCRLFLPFPFPILVSWCHQTIFVIVYLLILSNQIYSQQHGYRGSAPSPTAPPPSPITWLLLALNDEVSIYFRGLFFCYL